MAGQMMLAETINAVAQAALRSYAFPAMDARALVGAALVATLLTKTSVSGGMAEVSVLWLVGVGQKPLRHKQQAQVIRNC